MLMILALPPLKLIIKSRDFHTNWKIFKEYQSYLMPQKMRKYSIWKIESIQSLRIRMISVQTNTLLRLLRCHLSKVMTKELSTSKLIIKRNWHPRIWGKLESRKWKKEWTLHCSRNLSLWKIKERDLHSDAVHTNHLHNRLPWVYRREVIHPKCRKRFSLIKEFYWKVLILNNNSFNT